MTNGTDLLHGFAGTAGIAAILAGVAAGWQRIKAFSAYMISVLVIQRECNGYMMTSPLIEHIRGNYKPTPSGSGFVTSIQMFIDDRSMSSTIPFLLPHKFGVWRGKRGWFMVSADAGSQVKLSCLRWLADPEALIIDALNQHEERKIRDMDSSSAGNYRVIPVMGSVGQNRTDWEMHRSGSASEAKATPNDGMDTPPLDSHNNSWLDPNVRVDKSFMYEKSRYLRDMKKRDPMRGLFYPQSALDMLEGLRRWYRKRDWYQERGIPWRTGVLMWGPGGTGKSSMAKVVAETLGLPLYQFYLNTFTDRDFVRKWSEMDTPCVVALEDFDTVFHGREPATEHKSLSFEVVLNQISGISSLSGVLLMVTTNHIDHIDAALGRIDDNGRPTRPGRIDHILHMGTTTEGQRQSIADYTLADIAPEIIDQLVLENGDTTAAQFQSLCIQAAMERLSAPDVSKLPVGPEAVVVQDSWPSSTVETQELIDHLVHKAQGTKTESLRPVA